MNPDAHVSARKNRLSVLARCKAGRLQHLWNRLGLDPSYQTLRGPETGLVMLRGRVGGTGEPFNVGEATVTRASVRLDDGTVGHAMTLGRDGAKARLVALIDALCENYETAMLIEADLIAPMQKDLEREDEMRRQQAAATRVDFFTMVRGED